MRNTMRNKPSMIELPRALQPWAQELELFPSEVATAFAPLLPRLDRLIGPLRASPKQGQGEPDGFDGFSRRGIYDRLLVSEWLLAEEDWLEFARRAATGEHAFLKLAQREPQGAPLSLVVFDAGPSQLGAPRLLHLASLVVLFRRAENSGAYFRWGVLQQPDIAPHETLNESNIRALLLARSSREATPADWQTWQSFAAHMSQMPQYRAEAPDCWIVGGERLQRALRVLDSQEITSSLLCVRESLEIEGETQRAEIETSQFGAAQAETRQVETTQNAARQLLVSVVTRENWQSKPREIALNLPDGRIGARLLRDPFSVVAVETRRTPPRFASFSNLLWASATKLMARSADGASLIVYAVPNSPRAGVGKPRLYRPDCSGTVVAAGRARKAVVVVSKIDEKTSSVLYVQAWGKGSDNVPQGRFELPIALPESRDETLLPCCIVPNTSPASLLALLPARRLAKLISRVEPLTNATRREASYENQNALALNARFEDAVFVAANRGVVRVKKAETSDVRKFGQEIQQTFIGWSEKPEQADFGLVAVRLDKTSWFVASQHTEIASFNWTWNIPSSTRIIGVMNLQSWPTPALIAIENERTIVLRGAGWEQELLTASAPIEHASASPFSSDIALRLTSGEVAVWSLAHNAWTLRLAPETAISEP